MRRRHHFISFMAAILPAPEAREARGGAQCKGPALLTVSSLDRLMKATLGHCLIARLGQQQLTAKAQQLGFLKMLVILSTGVRGSSSQARVAGPARLNAGFRQ
jgi:hypothetical protein